jgi:putative DNA methylase
MRDEAFERIGTLYPQIEVTAAMAKERPDLKKYVGQKLTVIAWLWARTVKSPNPAFSEVYVPLISTFVLSSKPGKEAWVEPVVERGNYQFTIQTGKAKDPEKVSNGTKLGRGANFMCLMSGVPMASEYIKAEGKQGLLGSRLMAIVAEGDRERVYLAPTTEHETKAAQATPEWSPEVSISGSTQYLGVKPYGMEKFSQLFTNRQTLALSTFCGLIAEAMEFVKKDALAFGLADDGRALRDGGVAASAYAEAVAVYLACGVSRSADFWSSLCIWANQPKNELVMHLFGRQAIPMAWDYGEVNPFSSSGGNFIKNLSYTAMGIDFLAGAAPGSANQFNAATNLTSTNKVVSTDPPYYDNVPYADLSDYFYVWLRKSLRVVFPDLFATLAVPKAEELVAFAYRHTTGRLGAEYSGPRF